MTSIAGIDIVTVALLPTTITAMPAVISTIERRRIPSARLRRALSKRRRGSAPSHLSYSSSSVAFIAANAAADALP